MPRSNFALPVAPPALSQRASRAAAALALVLAPVLLAAGGCVGMHHRDAAAPPAPPAPAAAVAATTAADATQPLLLVSLDGFRADYLQRGITPNLSRLAREGASGWMRPSYPALTFPNHYTIVTGLRPDRHGIVHNDIRDAALGRFRIADRAAVGDGRWWGGEPLWVGVEKAGRRSATLFWPGSEAAIGGVRPARWRRYDGEVTPSERVDAVLAWLGEPASRRPHLVTLYFDTLDHAGHDFGPDSPQADAAIVQLDAAIGRLRDGLDARGVLDAVNLVLVSDHGMATVAPGQAIAVEDMVDPQLATAVSSGQSVGFDPLPGREREARARLLGKHDRYDCWDRQRLPARWHYGRHPRVPAIVCQMHEGWDALTRERLARRPPGITRGSHGYDPALPSMRALFVARGPAFRPGVMLPGFDNVDAYPLLAHLAGIAPAANDGDIAPLLPALRDRPSVRP